MTPRILVVDDDAAVRMTVVLMLQHEGYDVVDATDGLMGLEAAAQERFDLVVTNHQMPRMNGDELATSLRRLYPGIPILRIGSTLEGRATDIQHWEGRLDKPFSLLTLRETVRELLEHRHNGEAGR